jgi:hypothetical protein
MKVSTTMNQVHLTMPRTEAFQLLTILSNRLGDLRTHVATTDYLTKYGQEMGEQVKHDDEVYTRDLQIITARLLDVL